MELGSKWNEWTINEFIGEGSFGKVYKIVRHEFGHTYESALKVIRIPQSKAEEKAIRNDIIDEESVTSYFESMVEDIVEEITLMSELRGSSNIVSYEDHSVQKLEDDFGWEIFIRMELLTPLFLHLKEKTLVIRDVVQMGIDICRALEVCQKYNIIHRDIKPENIFYSKLGTYKLGDFGIARQMEKTSGAMSKKGTFSYIAPEVYKGSPYNSTVDIYSLGIVLYRFLNKHRLPFLPPFPQPVKYFDKEEAMIRRMGGEQIPYPCNAQGRLGEIILKACAYDPKDRYESPSEMRQALEQIMFTEEEEKLNCPVWDVLTTKDHSNQENSTDTENEPTHPTEMIESDMLSEETKVRTSEESQPETAKDKVEPQLVEEDSGILSPTNPKVQGRPLYRRPVLWILIVLLITAICTGIGGYQFYHHQVPLITGLTEAKAEETLHDAGLKYKETGREFSETIDRNCIVTQSIEAGDAVKKGTVVEVVISKGEAISAPDLTGKTVKKAKKTAEKKKLEIKVSKKKYSDTIEKGCVISQKPAAGEICEEGTIIAVIKSKGIQQVEVPKVIGKSQEDAEEALEEAKLQAEITTAYSSSVGAGYVIDQYTEAGKTVDKNSTVTIVVSQGPAPVYRSSSRSSSSKKSSSSGSSSRKSRGGEAK